MNVTIKATNDVMGLKDLLTGIDFNLVTITEKTKRNGFKVVEVRVKGEKRDIRFANGTYSNIEVQDEESGRYILKYSI